MKCMLLVCLTACVAVVHAAPHRPKNALLKEELRELIRQQLLERLGRPSAHHSSDYARGHNYNGEAYNDGASGAEGSQIRNAGRREFHNDGQHHSKVTKVIQKESSEKHSIGGSETYDNSAAAGSRFNKYANGASNSANDYERGQQQRDIVFPNYR